MRKLLKIFFLNVKNVCYGPLFPIVRAAAFIFNFVFLLLIDIPKAIFTVPRRIHYWLLFVLLYYQILSAIDYWWNRYLGVEDWIYDDRPSQDFDNHYFQWRFFQAIRWYLKGAIILLLKLFIYAITYIVHMFIGKLYLFFVVNWEEENKEMVLNKIWFILTKIIFAFRVRINLSLKGIFTFSVFDSKFRYFDEEGWYYIDRDLIDYDELEIRLKYGIPDKFKIKTGPRKTEEQSIKFKAFLNSITSNYERQLPRKQVKSFIKDFEKIFVAKNVTKVEAFRLFDNVAEVVEKEYWLYQQKRLQKRLDELQLLLDEQINDEEQRKKAFELGETKIRKEVELDDARLAYLSKKRRIMLELKDLMNNTGIYYSKEERKGSVFTKVSKIVSGRQLSMLKKNKMKESSVKK